jgi:hypothetical protein
MPNDEVERRGSAPMRNEDDLSQSSTPSLAILRRVKPFIHPCTRLTPASQRRDFDRPHGLPSVATSCGNLPTRDRSNRLLDDAGAYVNGGRKPLKSGGRKLRTFEEVALSLT